MQCLDLPLSPFQPPPPLPPPFLLPLLANTALPQAVSAILLSPSPPKAPSLLKLPPSLLSPTPCTQKFPLLQAVSAMLPSSKCIPEGFRDGVAHLNSTAHVQMALHGTSLHRSLLTASQLLQRHRRRMHGCQGAAHAAVMPGKVRTTSFGALGGFLGAAHAALMPGKGCTSLLSWGSRKGKVRGGGRRVVRAAVMPGKVGINVWGERQGAIIRKCFSTWVPVWLLLLTMPSHSDSFTQLIYARHSLVPAGLVFVKSWGQSSALPRLITSEGSSRCSDSTALDKQEMPCMHTAHQ